mmetsp:Transcript_1346/g.3874  ORF Transcript_1346/g.3874 Transcript_1346/m.3874 type:complete len:179 (-) Transcript_1346:95-631(-)
MPQLPPRRLPNFSWVLDGQLAGCGAPRFAGNLGELQEKGVHAILSLTEDPLEAMLAALPEGDMEAAVQALAGMRCLHVPVPDFTAPSPEQLGQCCSFLEASQAEGLPVAVHCAHGIGRTGTVLAAFLVHSTGCSAEDAVTRLRELRPGSVETACQMAAIRRFAEQSKFAARGVSTEAG